MSVFRKLRFFIVDWWQSAGEHRSLGDDSMRAVRDASHVVAGRLVRSPSEQVLSQAAEANDRYTRSFKQD